MQLSEFDAKNTSPAKRALTEHYKMPFNLDNMSMFDSKTMLQKVRRLMSETKQSPSFYKSQNNPAYLKMVFMEQALTRHVSELARLPRPRIMTENVEVEKSQVVLAAQDMVDSVQKMLEQISDMMVKELPALVDSVQSEIGVDESQQFSQQVSDALGGLTSALTQAKTTLQGALNVVTGQGGMDTGAFDGSEDLGMDAGADLGAEETDADGFGDDMSGDTFPEADEEEPESASVASLGRARR